MTASQVGYERVEGWVKGMLAGTHRTVVRTVAGLVLCLLLAQRLTPAALARALAAEQAGSGRARLTRIQRWREGPPLEQTVVSPALVRQALAALAPGQPVLVALDTTRLGGWEVWLAGVVLGGRVLPIGWAGCPYPWPQGRCRATTLALIARRQAAFPPGVRWRLVAERGFPSAALFGQLRQGGSAWTVRLRLSDWLTVGGVYAPVRDHLDAGRLAVGQRTAASIGRGKPDQPLVPGWVVVSQAVAELPRHKRNPGTARERAARAKRAAPHRRHQQGRKTKAPSAAAQRYAQPWVLFTTAPTVEQAVWEYRGRMAIAETDRDWHRGWGVRAAVVALPTEATVERLIGVVCLTDSLQLELGRRLSADPVGQARRAQWTVTDRVSWCWCGQRLLDDPGDEWSGWLGEQWATLGPPAVRSRPSPQPAPPLAEAA